MDAAHYVGWVWRYYHGIIWQMGGFLLFYKLAQQNSQHVLHSSVRLSTEHWAARDLKKSSRIVNTALDAAGAEGGVQDKSGKALIITQHYIR